MTHSEKTFIQPSKVQSTFFESLSADKREFYANIFVALRSPNRQWLALALYNWHKYKQWPEENRNPFMQSLFSAITEAEDFAAFEDKIRRLGAVHEAEAESTFERLKKWFHNRFTLSFHKS